MRKEAKTEITKEKIMALAMMEFGANGYVGASLNNICNKGISKGLLYHNYSSKDALYLACVERSFRTLTEFLKSKDIGFDFQAYLKARVTFFTENENEARLFFEAILQPPILLKEKILKAKEGFDDFYLELCEKIFDHICLRTDVQKEDAIKYFLLIQEMINGYFSSPIMCSLSFSDTMVAHENGLAKVLDFILYGIARVGDN